MAEIHQARADSKKLLFESKARLLKALAHPTRVAIFETLARGEMTVGELVSEVGAKPAVTSRHLALMRSAGLVAARKEGLNVHYSVARPCLLSALLCLNEAVCGIAEDHAIVARQTFR